MADLSRAIQLDPKDASAYVARGSIDYIEEKDAEAITDYTKALEIDPKRSQHGNRSLARSEKGDYQGAIADANQAVADEPKSADN